MKTIKVSEATNIQLDWLVAKCEGRTPSLHEYSKGEGRWFILMQTGIYRTVCAFSTECSQMGPIIEREGISTNVNYQDDAFGEVMHRVGWKASLWNSSVPGSPGFLQWAYGDTALEAAARCRVMSKLGDTVEVPEELM